MKRGIRKQDGFHQKMVRDMMIQSLPGIHTGSGVRRGGKLSSRARKNHCLFLRFATLTRLEEKMDRQKGYSPIPFHQLMTRLSPLYKAIFQVGKRMRIRLRPSEITLKQSLMQFDPFADHTIYPKTVKKKYLRISKQEYCERVFRNWEDATGYGFSSYHDLLHLILVRLIPSRPGENMRNYLFFIEAIVNVIEIQISAELGPEACQVLWKTGTFYRSYSLGSIAQWDTDWQKAFVGNLLFYLGDLHGVPGKRMRKMFPAWKDYLHDERYFTEVFTSETVPRWFNAVGDLRCQSELVNRKMSLPTFRKVSFSLEDLKDETDVLLDLSRWLAKLLPLRTGTRSAAHRD